MPGMNKDKVKKPTAMKMTQMRNGKETMKKMSGGKNTKKAKVMKAGMGTNKTMVGKKKFEMRGMAPGGKIENFQDYVSRMFGGGPTK